MPENKNLSAPLKENSVPKVSKTRARILETAFQLFMRHGYDGTSLSQIVGMSDVSKGAFYHHFGSKFSIYQEVVDTFFLAPYEGFDAPSLAKLSPKKAKALLRTFYRSLPEQVSTATDQDMARFFALFFDSFSRLPEFRAKISGIYNRLLKALAQTLAQSKSPNKRAKRNARKFLARLEGEIFLSTIL